MPAQSSAHMTHSQIQYLLINVYTLSKAHAHTLHTHTDTHKQYLTETPFETWHAGGERDAFPAEQTFVIIVSGFVAMFAVMSAVAFLLCV